jgi:hypothetical protein
MATGLMNETFTRKHTTLVLVDCERLRYSRYVGAFQDRVVEALDGRVLTSDEIEHFRINPSDFIETHCRPESA